MITSPHSRPGNDRLVTETQLGQLVAEVKRVLGLRVVVVTGIDAPQIERAGESFILRIPRTQIAAVPDLAALQARVDKVYDSVARAITEDPYHG